MEMDCAPEIKRRQFPLAVVSRLPRTQLARRVRLPQASHCKQHFAGLNETDAFFIKTIGENQAAVMQVRLERGQMGDGFALGIDERLFVPRHTPAPVHLPACETFVFRDAKKMGFFETHAVACNALSREMSQGLEVLI